MKCHVMFRQNVHGSCPSFETSTTVLKNTSLISWHATLTWHHDCISIRQSKLGEPGISFTSTSQHVPQQNNFGSYFEGTIQDLNPSNSCLVRLFPRRAIREPNEKRLFHSRRLTRTHKMIRVDSIHKTLLQFLPTWDVPTAKILRNRMIHFREHDKPNRNQDRWSPQVCLRRSTESGSVHSSKVWFRVIGSIGSGKGRVVGKAIPPLSTTATWRLEPSGFTFTESRHSHSVKSSLSTHLGMDRCVPLYMVKTSWMWKGFSNASHPPLGCKLGT